MMVRFLVLLEQTTETTSHLGKFEFMLNRKIEVCGSGPYKRKAVSDFQEKIGTDKVITEPLIRKIRIDFLLASTEHEPLTEIIRKITI